MTSFGDYAEGLGTLRASGGDAGGGSEVLVLESNQNHARTEDTEICFCLTESMGLGGGYVSMIVEVTNELSRDSRMLESGSASRQL